MRNQDKDVIKHWLRLYNRLKSSSFRVEDWPDKDSSRPNVDAVCCDNDGHSLSIEHTLIEPFEGEKEDAVRFERTLGSLENHPLLVSPENLFVVSQPVDSVPVGTNWNDIRKALLEQLAGMLLTLPEGDHSRTIRDGEWEVTLRIKRIRLGPNSPGKFLTARTHPGDQGSELLIRALRKKAPKLVASSAEKKILLLEKDAVAGTVERQFEQIPVAHEIRDLLVGIDEVWSVDTAGLKTENVIFTRQIVPFPDRDTFCSLNIGTGEFWQVPRKN